MEERSPGVAPSTNNSSTSNVQATVSSPPSIDIAEVQNTYHQMKASSSESPALLNMYALMLNIHSRQAEIDTLKNGLQQTNSRLDALEAN